MAIVFTNQGASASPDIASGVNATSYASGSWTPPNELVCVFVFNRAASGAPTLPTMSGNSLTWTQIATLSDGTLRITLFGANGSGASAGATTIDFGGVTQTACQASFFSASGVDLTGGVAAAFVQSPTNTGTASTSLSITLSAAGHADNRPISGFFHSATEATTFRTNWTEVDDLTAGAGGGGLETQYRSDTFETTASASWTSAVNSVGIAAELKATVAGSVTAKHLATLGVG